MATRPLAHPFPGLPKPGEIIEVAPGILWTRMPLPLRLNHVNIYLIDDGDGWAVLDAGVNDERGQQIWDALTTGPLRGRPLTRVIVSHHHLDHIGAAGWLCERYDLPLAASQTCYLHALILLHNPDIFHPEAQQGFRNQHGMWDEIAAMAAARARNYQRLVAPMPPTFTRLVAGEVLNIGGRRFNVLSGDGHAPEQIMLHLPEENLFLGADQVLSRITPHIGVWPIDPEGDPLGLFLRSLERIATEIPAESLTLPGHQLPFTGLHERCRQLVVHHHERCHLIAEMCRQKGNSVADLVPVLFPRPLDQHQLGFAFAETHAHVNFMVHRGELAWAEPQNGVRLVTAR